jgi:hypothetical protein
MTKQQEQQFQKLAVSTLKEFERRGTKVDESTLRGAMQIQSEMETNRALLELVFDGEMRLEYKGEEVQVVAVAAQAV